MAPTPGVILVKITAGAFEPQNDLRSVPENEKQFLFKPFTNLKIIKGHGFAAKVKRSGNPDG